MNFHRNKWDFHLKNLIPVTGIQKASRIVKKEADSIQYRQWLEVKKGGTLEQILELCSFIIQKHILD